MVELTIVIGLPSCGKKALLSSLPRCLFLNNSLTCLDNGLLPSALCRQKQVCIVDYHLCFPAAWRTLIAAVLSIVPRARISLILFANDPGLCSLNAHCSAERVHLIEKCAAFYDEQLYAQWQPYILPVRLRYHGGKNRLLLLAAAARVNKTFRQTNRLCQELLGTGDNYRAEEDILLDMQEEIEVSCESYFSCCDYPEDLLQDREESYLAIPELLVRLLRQQTITECRMNRQHTALIFSFRNFPYVFLLACRSGGSALCHYEEIIGRRCRSYVTGGLENLQGQQLHSFAWCGDLLLILCADVRPYALLVRNLHGNYLLGSLLPESKELLALRETDV